MMKNVDFYKILKTRLARRSMVFLFSNSLDKLIPFLLLPILARYLSPEEYGMVALYTSINVVVQIIVSMSIDGAVSVFYFRDEKIDFSRLLGAAQCIILLTGFSIAILVFFWGDHLATVSSLPVFWLYMMVISALASSSFFAFLQILNVQGEAIRLGFFQVTKSALDLGLSLALVISIGLGWRGRAAAIVFVNLLCGSIAFGALYRAGFINFSFDRATFIKYLKFGVPLVPHAIAGWVIAVSDRVFINHMVGLDATGIYATGYTVGMAIGLITQSFNQAWSPVFYEKLQRINDTLKLKIVKFTYIYICFVIILASITSWLGCLVVVHFFPPQYQGAVVFIPYVSFSYVFYATYAMMANYLLFRIRTSLLASITTFSALSNLFLNYILIKANGPIGAAQATIISVGFSAFLAWIFARKIFPMPWGAGLREILYSVFRLK